MKKLVFYGLSLGLIILAMTISGMKLHDFYDLLTIMLMLVAGLLAWFNWGNIERATQTTGQLLKKQQMLQVFWRYQMMVAIFSWVINLIIVLADQGETMATIGQGLALLLISSIYLLLLRLLVIQPKIVEAEKALIMLRK